MSTAVWSHHVWLRDFGAAPDALGETIRANRRVFTIVGVAPEGFRSLFQGLGPELWLHIETGMAMDLDPLQGSGGRTPGLELVDDRNRRWLGPSRAWRTACRGSGSTRSSRAC